MTPATDGSLAAEEQPLEPAPIELTDWEAECVAVTAELQARRNATVRRHAEPWVAVSDLLAREFPPASWLVQGLIAQGSFGIIGADPKAGKSWALLELSLAVAGGGPAFGEFEAGEPGNVLLFMTEDNARSVRNRMRALCAGRGLTPEKTSEVTSRIGVRVLETLDLLDPQEVIKFIADVRCAGKPALLGLDPLRNLHGANENDSTEMRSVIKAIQDIRALCGCTILLVHHSAKSGGEGDKRTAGARLRGSSALDGARDALLSLEGTEKDDDGQSITSRAVVSLKAHRGAGAFRLTLNIEDDEHGEAIKATWEHERVDQKKTKKGKAADEEPEVTQEDKDKANYDRCHKAIMIFVRRHGEAGCSLRAIREAVAPQVHLHHTVVTSTARQMASNRFLVIQELNRNSKVTVAEGYENAPE